jgi:Flp pilus assembly protein TadG
MNMQHADKRSRRRASVVLEVALLLPLLLAVILATIEFGYAFYIKHTLQGASREGARRAIISGATNADVQNTVAGAMEAGGLGNSTYTLVIRNGQTKAAASVTSVPAGTPVIVEVQADWSQYSVFLSGLGSWINGSLVGRTTMRREAAAG